MTESEFNDMIDQTFEALELALDEVEDDLDYDTGGGVLTVEHGVQSPTAHPAVVVGGPRRGIPFRLERAGR
jgi:hypothetical protein